MEDFGIIVTAFNRPLFLADVLSSLEKQDALKYTEVWIDGHQGVSEVKVKTDQVYDIASNFSVKKIQKHNGSLGFRKMMMHVLVHAMKSYKKILILEDDCFPTRDAVNVFRKELAEIEKNDKIFSVYGHPFLVPGEKDTITRFQGWGWGTTSKKLKPLLEKLIDCYSMTEEEYLNFTKAKLTPSIISKLDVTPPRLPTKTLTKFFAWDETLALLTVLDGLVHKKTSVRTIFNFGASADSSRFKKTDWFNDPPYNMVSHEAIWDYY